MRVIERLLDDPTSTGEFAWFGWHADPHRFRRKWAEDGLLSQDGGFLMIVREQDRLGLVNWRHRSGTPYGFRWEIGIALVPEARGHGYGTLAQRMLVSYLFAHTPVHRIEASTEADNVAEQRSLEKAGFRREGVLRGVGWRDGAWRDGMMYSVLRTD